MANYNQDNRYQSQYNSSQSPNAQYGARPPPPTAPLPRLPSFERDDDAQYFEGNNAARPNAPPAPGQYGAGNGYGSSSNQGQRPDAMQSSPSNASYRHTYSPQSPALPTQPYQPPSNSSYNPQAYNNMARATTVMQSYNPAAYRHTDDRRTSQPAYGYGASQGGFNSTPYQAPAAGNYPSGSSPQAMAPQSSYFGQQQASPSLPPAPAPARAHSQYVPYQPSRYASTRATHSPYAAYTAPAPPPPPALPDADYDSPYERASPSGRSPASQQYHQSPNSDLTASSPSLGGATPVYANDNSAINSGYFPPPHPPPTSQIPSPPGHPPGPPRHQIPVRSSTNAAHPLPAPPQDSYSSEGSDDSRNGVGHPDPERLAQEELYRDVEEAVYRTSGGGSLHGRQSHPNGTSAVHGGQNSRTSIEDDLDSDPEAAAGILAMQQDEQQSGYFGTSQPVAMPPQPTQPAELSSDSDYPPVGYDLGGYAPYQPSSSQRPLPMPTGGVDWNNIPIDARVDRQGTGGFAEPGHDRHPSFDDGEDTIDDYRRSGSQSPVKDEYGYPLGSSSSAERPLPPVPGLMPAGTYLGSGQSQSQYGQPAYPADSNSYGSSLYPSTPAVPRSTSLNSHTSSNQTHPYVIRSKTDAEEREQRRQSRLHPNRGSGLDTIPGSAVTGSIDLPSIPQGRRKKFDPEKMSSSQFRKCTEPWALSAVAAWLKDMSDGETDLKQKTVVDAIVALFTHKVPTMNIADAETLAERVVQDMLASRTLVREEEWVKFTLEPTSGVLWQLAGSGCYAPRLHSQDGLDVPMNPGRCYAHHCSRTLKKINLQTSLLEPQKKKEDWATFYKLKKEDIENRTKKEIECQNNLHEIVQGEDLFLDGMNVLRVLYRDALRTASILTPTKADRFLRDVFGKVDAVKKVNDEFLLQPMLLRQQDQGPWILGFSDLFRNWIRKAKSVFIEYATGFPNAVFQVKKEADRNANFRQFLDQVRQNERSRRLDYSTFLKSPITRIQHYSLLLGVVAKNMIVDSEEKTNLLMAIDEIKAVTRECDARVAEQGKKIELLELEKTLIMRNDPDKINLNLSHLGRELVFRGDLQRAPTSRFTSLVDIHAILFDHYLVIAKKEVKGDPTKGTRQEYFDVTKQPIAMDLLILESANDDSIIKSSRLGATVTRTQTPSESRLGKTLTNQSPGQERPGFLSHTTTSSSIASVSTTSSGKTMIATTVIDAPKDEKVMFPFRIKHLGKSASYTLYASSAQNRQDWCDHIVQAKTKHAAALFQQNAEPFKLRVLADCAFADSSSTSARTTLIRGTPLDRAIREVEKSFEGAPRPMPICKVQVNCATTFNQPYGMKMVAVGTDIGVYVAEAQNPRGWNKTISIGKVTQIAVLEEFSLFILIADKSLIAYHLDVVCPVNGVPPANDSQRRAPQKLSGNKDVGFFAVGRMKDRTLVFYKKKDNINSVFKVLEPIFQKSTEKKSRFFRKGTTEFFREYDEFYIPTETYNIQLFNTSLAVGSHKGFEVLTLDKKMPSTLPDLQSPGVAAIVAEISNQQPLGMFRLNDQFLLCYERCAVYVNKHGEISTGSVMKYVGKATHAAVSGQLVLLFDNDFVEVRDAQNGRLKQIIYGRDVRCLDDGSNGRTSKIAMQHPEQDKSQVILELLPNEGRRELD